MNYQWTSGALSVLLLATIVTWSDASAQFASDLSDCHSLGAVPEVDRGQSGPGDGELADPLAASLACRRVVDTEPDNAAARFLLGRALFHLEDPEALHHLRQAANAGFTPAHLYLGYVFETGIFGERDWKQSFDHYLPAATAGSTAAQAMIGFYYFEGYGVDHDAYFGLLWLRRAADAGNLDAKAFLGMKTIDGEVGYALGERSSQQTMKEAAQMLLEAAEGGLASAQLILGTYLQDDHRTLYFPNMKPDAAVYWLNQAAAEFPDALAQLGLIHIRGEIVPKDVQLGLDYLCSAGEVGLYYYEGFLRADSPHMGELTCDPS